LLNFCVLFNGLVDVGWHVKMTAADAFICVQFRCTQLSILRSVNHPQSVVSHWDVDCELFLLQSDSVVISGTFPICRPVVQLSSHRQFSTGLVGRKLSIVAALTRFCRKLMRKKNMLQLFQHTCGYQNTICALC